ncbi:MAG: phosphotransferase [Defluviitaleaceae bacterium]|nr:phosphotransferase [Defluviitaleaceae bacterium]
MLTQPQYETLLQVLCKMLNTIITGASYESASLKGGTVGDVRLITGVAQSASGETVPYKLVLKIQKKWARWGDPDSWRREYDLYMSCLAETFTDTFTWPRCYHGQLYENETQLWMEYVEGVAGNDLTTPMLAKAAYELGKYQGRLHNNPAIKNITNLHTKDAREIHYRHWKPKNLEYSYIRESDCPIPKHLRDMIIDVDARANDIFSRIKQLPEVICHRDYWTANIISAGGIYAIDWDSTGWGYLGEDIISLITDETNPALWAEYKARLIPAYLKGIVENMDIKGLDVSIFSDMALTSGYMYVHNFMHEKSPEGKEYYLLELQQLYETFAEHVV